MRHFIYILAIFLLLNQQGTWFVEGQTAKKCASVMQGGATTLSCPAGQRILTINGYIGGDPPNEISCSSTSAAARTCSTNFCLNKASCVVQGSVANQTSCGSGTTPTPAIFLWIYTCGTNTPTQLASPRGQWLFLSEGQYASASDATGNVKPSASGFSVALWVGLDSTTNKLPAAIIGRVDAQWGLAIDTDKSLLVYWAGQAWDTGYVLFQPSVSHQELLPNVYHLAIVYSSTTLSLYVNSVLMTSTTVAQLTAAPADSTIVFGGKWTSYVGNGLNGWFDEIAIWNSAITSTVITQHMTQNSLGTTPTGLWHLDGDLTGTPGSASFAFAGTGGSQFAVSFLHLFFNLETSFATQSLTLAAYDPDDADGTLQRYLASQARLNEDTTNAVLVGGSPVTLNTVLSSSSVDYRYSTSSNYTSPDCPFDLVSYYLAAPGGQQVTSTTAFYVASNRQYNYASAASTAFSVTVPEDTDNSLITLQPTDADYTYAVRFGDPDDTNPGRMALALSSTFNPASFAISFWFSPGVTSPSAAYTLFSACSGTTVNIAMSAAGQMSATVATNTVNSGSFVFNHDRWYWIYVSWSSNNLKLFVNTVQLASNTAASSTINTASVSVGSNCLGTTPSFGAKIHDVRLYSSVAPSPSLPLFNAASGTAVVTCLMNEGSGTQPSCTGATATLSGETYWRRRNEPSCVIQTLTAILASGPSNGVLYQTADGVNKGSQINSYPATVTDAQYRVIYESTLLNSDATDSFTYKAADQSGFQSAAATVTINVVAVSDPPSVSDVWVVTDENTGISITLPATDPGFTPTIYINSLPSRGELYTDNTLATKIATVPTALTGSTVWFQPADNEYGFIYAIFSWYAQGPTGLTSEYANAYINVTFVAQYPVPQNLSFSVEQTENHLLTLQAISPQGLPLTYFFTSSPTQGTLYYFLDGTPIATNVQYSDPRFIYVAGSTLGADIWKFKVNDGTVDSVIEATIYANIILFDNPPVAGNITQTIDEDTTATITLEFTDSDGPETHWRIGQIEGGTLTQSSVTLSTGTIIDSSDVVFTPEANLNGIVVLSYQAYDGVKFSEWSYITITITPVDDPCTANAQFVTVAEDGTAVFAVSGSWPDGPLPNPTVITNPVYGTASSIGGSYLQYKPDPFYFGTDNFTFGYNTGSVPICSAVVTVLVSPVFNSPVATNITVPGSGVSRVSINFLTTGAIFSPDGSAMQLVIVTPPTNGLLSFDNSPTYTAIPYSQFIVPITSPSPIVLSYYPQVPYFSTTFYDSFTFRALDVSVQPPAASQTDAYCLIRLDPAATTPIAISQYGLQGYQDTVLPITLEGSQPDGLASIVSFTVDATTLGGTLYSSSGCTGDLGTSFTTLNPTMYYCPPPSQHSPPYPYTEFTFTVQNSEGDTSAAGTVSITIFSVQHDPKAANFQVDTLEDLITPIDLQASSEDFPNNGYLQGYINSLSSLNGFLYRDASAVTQLQVGDVVPLRIYFRTLAFPSCGSSSANDCSSMTSFDYQVVDPDGYMSLVATVSINVTAVNDPPVAFSSTVNLVETTPLQSITLSYIDVDAHGPSSSIIRTTPALGTLYDSNFNEVVANANNVGVVYYYSPPLYENGVPFTSFTFDIVDDESAVSAVSATVTINIPNSNSAPTAYNYTVAMLEDQSLIIALNGTDDSTPLPDMVGLLTGASDGTLYQMDGTLISIFPQEVTIGQSFIYLPPLHSLTTQTITFTLTDAQGLTSGTGTITVTLTDSAHPPVAFDTTASLVQGSSLLLTPAIDLTSAATDIDTGDVLTFYLGSWPTDVGQFYTDNTDSNSNFTGSTPPQQLPANVFYFVPMPYYYGTFNVRFFAVDSTGLVSNDAYINITVTDIPDSPLLPDFSVDTLENQNVVIQLRANDTDSTSYQNTGQFKITSGVTLGRLYWSADGYTSSGTEALVGTTTSYSTVIYFPPVDQVGSPYDTFKYTTDANVDLAEAQVTINVLPIDQPPVAWGDWFLLDQEDTLTISFQLQGNDVDNSLYRACISTGLYSPLGSTGDLGDLYQLDSSNATAGIIDTSGTSSGECINVTNSNRLLQYVAPNQVYPKTNYPFSAFKFRLFDVAGRLSQEALIRFFVLGQNLPPIVYDQNLTLFENQAYTWVPNITDLTNTLDPTINITRIPTVGTLYQNVVGDITSSAIAAGDVVLSRVIYQPPDNTADYLDYWQYYACDATNKSLCSPVATVWFYVMPVNNPPEVTNFSTTVVLNSSSTFSLLNHATDAENDTLTFFVTQLPDTGPVYDVVGSNLLLIDCGCSPCSSCTMSYYEIQSPNATLRFVSESTVVASPYALVGWRAYDGTNYSDPGGVSIDLFRNLPPTAFKASAWMFENTNATVQLNGSDTDGGRVTPYITALPLRGTLYQYDGTPFSAGNQTSNYRLLVTDPLNRVLFVPVLYDSSAVDTTNSSTIAPYTSFSFIFVDQDNAASAIQQANMYVWPVDQPPSSQNLTITMREEDTKTLTLYGTDPEDDPMTFVLLAIPSQGQLYITLDGRFPLDASNPITEDELPYSLGITSSTFQLLYDSPRVNSNTSLIVTLVYSVRVYNGTEIRQQAPDAFIEIIVVPTADAPFANDVVAFTQEDQNVTIYLSGWSPDSGTVSRSSLYPIITDLPELGLLYQWANDTNVAVSELELIVTPYTDVTDKGFGNISNATWRVLYIPGLYGNGMPYTSFSYIISDGRLDSTAGVVTIYVEAVNNPPSAVVPRSQRAYLNSDFLISLGGSDVEFNALNPLQAFIVGFANNFLESGSALYQLHHQELQKEKLNFTAEVTRGEMITENYTLVSDPERRVILSPQLSSLSVDRAQISFAVQFFDGSMWSSVADISVLVQRPTSELPSGYTTTTGGWAGPLVGAAAAVVALLIIIGIIWYRNTRVGDGDDYINMFQDTEDQEAAPEEDDDDEPSQKSPLERLLLDEKYQVLNALLRVIDVAEYDNIAKALIDVSEYHGCTLEMLKYYITVEVQSATSAGTLFRANSIASKMMTAYTKMIGNEYLRVTLKNPIEMIIKKDHAMEVDPKKLKSGESRKANLKLLQMACQRFLDWIMSSTSNAPMPFKVLSNHLFYTVEKKFPASKHTAVGGFLFLRFFCPAIISPEGFKVIASPPTAPARRALVLIAKVLQNLANGVEFGKKEEFMIGLNEFIKRNMEPIKTYFDSMVALPGQLRKVPPTEVPLEKEMASLEILRGYLVDNRARVIDVLEGKDDASERSDSHSTSRSARSRTSRRTGGTASQTGGASSRGSSKGESRGSSRGESRGSSKESKGGSSKGSRIHRSRSDSSLHQKPFGEDDQDDEATEMTEEKSFADQSDSDDGPRILPIDPHQVFLGENGTEYIITEGEQLSDEDLILDDFDPNPFTLSEVGTETLRAEGGNVDWTEVGSSLDLELEQPEVQRVHEGFDQNGRVVDPVAALKSVLDSPTS